MPYIDANSIRISFQVHEPVDQNSLSTPKTFVVLVNGLADTKETWATQIPALTQASYTVLTFDNRGVGKTSHPAGPYSAALMAADLKALIIQLKIPEFHLIGVSMGGMIAQQYAIEHPKDLRSLTLACTYAAPGPFCSRMFKMWEDVVPVMGVPFVMRDVCLWAFTPDFFMNSSRAAELREVEQSMKYMTLSTPAYLAQLAAIQDFDVEEHISRINVPTLVLAGEQDILIPVDLSKRIHALIPGSHWVTVRGGHGCMWEFPETFNEAFLSFLTSLKQQNLELRTAVPAGTRNKATE